MPDTLEPAGGSRYPGDMEGRVSALEKIAQSTAATLIRLEGRFDVIDQRFVAIDQRFQDIDRRFDDIDRRFGAIDRRFESLDRRIDVQMAEHHRDFRWLIGLILGQTAALLGVMAHGFHWL